MSASETKGFMSHDSNNEFHVDYQPNTNHLNISTNRSPASVKRRSIPIFRQYIHRPLLFRFYISFLLCCIFIIFLLTVLLLLRTNCVPSEDLSKQSPDANNSANNSSKSSDTLRLWVNSRGQPCSYQQERLPQMVRPQKYVVHLHPNLTVPVPDYQGNVTITATCWEETQHIILHSAHHVLNHIKIWSESRKGKVLYNSSRNSTNITAEDGTFQSSWEECTKLQQINIGLRHKCLPGEEIKIVLFFDGLIRTTLEGFYLSNYTSIGNAWRLATTQMEPYEARLAFPCFDEPSMKAKFKFSIVREEKYFSLFNAPLVQTRKLENDLFLDEFDDSETMSTYLVAFIVVPKDYVFVNDTYRNVSIRVFAPSSQRDNMRLALNSTMKYLRFFEDFFGVPYTMPKLDSIVVPDFSHGAMENWGLIIYRPQTMLYNEKRDSFLSKVHVLKVVAHELAHQWFGNIVTMKWWNDIWLNEGFASYMEMLAAEEADNSFKYRDFNYVNYMVALRMDAVVNTHPVAVPENYTNAGALFDSVSYKKGAALVEMMESFMGLSNVKKGMQYYLNKHRYNNTVSNDLWDAMTQTFEITNAEKKLNVRQIMNTWSGQSNFPMVCVHLNEDGRSFTVQQERFLLFDGGVKMYETPFHSPYGFKWNIPLKYITDSEPKEQLAWLFSETNATYPLTKPAKWIKINHGHRGFFLTNYDIFSWNQILAQLRADSNKFSYQDRAGFLFDAFEIASAGRLNISVGLDLLSTLTNDTEFLPWRVGTDVIQSLSRFLYSDYALHQKLQLHVQDIVQPLLTHPKISWNAATDKLTVSETMVRSNLLKVALLANEPSSVKIARGLFQDYLVNESLGDRNVFPHVVAFGLQEGTTDEWEMVWERLQSSADPGIANSLRTALASTDNWRLLYRLLAYTLDPRKVRITEAVRLMIEMGKMPIASDIVWAFLQRHALTIKERLGDQKTLVNDLALSLAQGFMTQYHYQEMESFFANNAFGQSMSASHNLALEQIQVNMNWLRHNLETIRAYYEDKYPDLQ